MDFIYQAFGHFVGHGGCDEDDVLGVFYDVGWWFEGEFGGSWDGLEEAEGLDGERSAGFSIFEGNVWGIHAEVELDHWCCKANCRKD